MGVHTTRKANPEQFVTLPQMRKYVQAWVWIYNNERPHSALGRLTPAEFLLHYGKLGDFFIVQQDKNEKVNWNYLVLNVAK